MGYLDRRFAGGRLLHSRPAAWLGLVSYGIYLYHQPIMQHIHLHTGSTLGNLLLLGIVGGTIAITCATFLRRRRSPGQCRHCGYDLRASTKEICPECGTEIPPEQWEEIKKLFVESRNCVSG